MEMFDQGHVRAALETATVLLVPAFKSMSELPCPGDEQVIERVREDWCNCLTHPSLSDGKPSVQHSMVWCWGGTISPKGQRL